MLKEKNNKLKISFIIIIIIFLFLITPVGFTILGCGGKEKDKQNISATKFKDSKEAALRLSNAMGIPSGISSGNILEQDTTTEEEETEVPLNEGSSGNTGSAKYMAPKVFLEKFFRNLGNVAFGTLVKKSHRIKQKHGFDIRDILSCDNIEEPECAEGKVENFDCKSMYDRKAEKYWMQLEIALSNCKMEYQEEENGQYKNITEIADGKLKVYFEIVEGGRMVFEADGDITSSELVNGELRSKVRVKPSNFKIESYAEEIKSKGDSGKYAQTVISTDLISGKLLTEDLIENKKEEFSFYDFKTKTEYKYTEYSSSEEINYAESIDVKIEISGIYSVDTFPDSCIEGNFQFETIEPIIPSLERDCPMSGKIKVNNSTLEFSSDKVIVSVDNQRETYFCEEFLSLCEYEPMGIICGSAGVGSTGGANLIFLLALSFILFSIRIKIKKHSKN